MRASGDENKEALCNTSIVHAGEGALGSTTAVVPALRRDP
jgi:hypothetical protein